MALFTFLPMEEIQGKYGKLEGADLREAKEALAFEATKIVHGEEEAQKARVHQETFCFSFGWLIYGRIGKANDEDSTPTTFMEREKFIEGIPVFKLFETTGLCSSGSEARRLIEQGGAYINKKK